MTPANPAPEPQDGRHAEQAAYLDRCRARAEQARQEAPAPLPDARLAEIWQRLPAIPRAQMSQAERDRADLLAEVERLRERPPLDVSAVPFSDEDRAEFWEAWRRLAVAEQRNPHGRVEVDAADLLTLMAGAELALFADRQRAQKAEAQRAADRQEAADAEAELLAAYELLRRCGAELDQCADAAGDHLAEPALCADAVRAFLSGKEVANG